MILKMVLLEVLSKKSKILMMKLKKLILLEKLLSNQNAHIATPFLVEMLKFGLLILRNIQ
jgi:hypothetical protein